MIEAFTYSLACWDTDTPCPDCGERVLLTNGEVAWCECGYWEGEGEDSE